MKSWGLIYSVSLAFLLVVTSCSNSDKKLWVKGSSDLVTIATDTDNSDFSFYENDAFSKFIKDLMCDPICYYDNTSKKVISNLISQFKWVHESEIELVVNTEVFFQNSEKLKIYQGQKLSAQDIIHSILLQRENTIYPQEKEFLTTFTKIRQKGKNAVVISLKKSVNPNDFLKEFASLEIPVISHLIKKVSSVKDVIGTGMYYLEGDTEEQLVFKLFKGHYSFLKNKKEVDFYYPSAYLIRLKTSPEEINKLFSKKSIDGAFLSEITEITNSAGKSLVETMFVRPEGSIHVAGFNFESSISTVSQNIEYLKKLINPEQYNNLYQKGLLNHYYSYYDIELEEKPIISTINITFDNCNESYKKYALWKLNREKIKVNENDSISDLMIYNLKIPSLNEELVDRYIFQYYTSKGFINNEQVSKEANVKLFTPVKYLVFNDRIKFLNENFEQRNDFLAIFKSNKQ